MAEYQNFTEMFAQSIGVKEPWQIKEAKFDEKERAVHIYIAARKTAKYPCPICGEMSPRYDDEEDERVWRHGDVVFFPCYVHCRRPRVNCKKDGIHVVEAPWARKGSRFTLLFESYAMLLAQSMTFNEARKLLRISNTAMTHIVRYWVDKAVSKQDLSNVTRLGIDETSFLRGQSYVTVITDPSQRRVIDVEPGRDAAAVEAFSYALEAHGGDCNQITFVSADMSDAYKKGTVDCFPKAKSVIDKFHVKKMLLDALNTVRMQEQGKQKCMRRDAGRKLLMIPQGRMSEQQLARLTTLSKDYPKTGRAFRMVQNLDTVYAATDLNAAKILFMKLCSWLKRSRLEPMKKVADSLRAHEQDILNYFLCRLTNAMSEGFNGIIQAAKRKARGFATYEGYRCSIFLVAGKLRLAPIPLFE